MNSITNLLAVHDVLDYVFFEHQRALLHFDLQRALLFLCEYETGLLKHMEYEEHILLPLYEDRVAFPGAGAPELFLTDHQKMREFITAFKSKIEDLVDTDEPEQDLIMLLDREAFYKRLSAHHDKRESDFLYPLLDRELTANEELHLLHTACEAASSEAVI